MLNVSERQKERLLIQHYYEKSGKVSEVAKELKLAESTVRRWIRREDVQDQPRSGRPSVLTKPMKQAAEKYLKEQAGHSIEGCVRELKAQFPDNPCGREAVRTWSLKQEWGRPYKIAKAPCLSQKNRADRVAFAQYVKANGFIDGDFDSQLRLKHVMFTDESPVDLFPEPNRQNYRFRANCAASVPKISVPKFGLSIMVAGGITGFGKTELIIVDEKQTIDAKYYSDKILPSYLWSRDDTNLFPDAELAVLQQDGAPAHNQFEVIGKIREFYGDNIWSKGIWPGNSPDLNLIENLWAILQASVFDSPRPRNRNELIERVKQTWDAIPQSTLDKLYASFPDRISSVLSASGGNTQY